jgi:glycosyltransferase involved in cell wall biosynthesis
MKKKIKVLYIGPSRVSRGGISSVLNAYMDSPLSKLFTLSWLETQHDKNRYLKLFYLVKSLILCPYYFLQNEIVHIHTASYNSFYRKSFFIIICKLLHRKLIIHIHGGGFGGFLKTGNRFKRKWIICLLQAADNIICLSALKADEINFHVEPKKIIIISNPCLFQTRASQKHLNNEIIILFSGWVEKEKGIFDLIQAFADVQKKHPNTRLIIAGKGRIKNAEQRTQQLGLKNTVLFTGWLQKNEMKNELTKADIFCLPSYCEGLPMSVIEAMAFSLPVVTTPVGGIPDIIIPGKTGFLVRPGNVRELVDTISCLVMERDLRQKVGHAAKEYIDRNCTIEIVSEKLNTLYESLNRNHLKK